MLFSTLVKGTFLEHLTWSQAEPLLRQTDVVLVPLGARLKEHGLHLPLNNDWRLAEYLSKRVVEAAPVVAVPTLQYGYYPAFTEYPGSISLRLETCRDLVVDVCRSLAPFGPKRFYVLNTGISTLRALAPAREILAREGLRMTYTDLSVDLADVEARVRQQEAGTHADEIETSMMLYIAPETVNLPAARRDIHPAKGPGGLTRDPNALGGVYSPTGAWGDPTLATREKGRIVVEFLVDRLLKAIEELRSGG
ncbi:MAG TPA: creatininase family protein [Planctomycetota bacterium]|nr:creatininase family protein [Planctomycetota bacterium]